MLKKHSKIRFMILNQDKSVNVNNIVQRRPISMSWGVFPDHDILTPSIVDAEMFQSWSQEVYQLLQSRWGSLYDSGSRSAEIINKIVSSYCHVSLVNTDHTDKHSSLIDILSESQLV